MTTTKPLTLKTLNEKLEDYTALAQVNADTLATANEELAQLRKDCEAFADKATLETSKLKVALSEATSKLYSLQSQLDELRFQQSHHRILLSLLSLGLALCGVAFGFGGLLK